MDLTSRNNKCTAIRLLIFFVVSAVYTLFVSMSTSPLYDDEGFDSLIFRIVAERWYNGLLPYVDTFDHKGPYLYLINMAGLIINRQYGILILQIINFTVVLELLYRIGKLFNIHTFSIFVSLSITLFVCLRYFPDGNMTEEWSLVFVLIPLYIFLRFLDGPRSSAPPMAEHHIAWSFIYGICLGIIFLIRANNASIICGIIIAAVILCVRQREWRVLVINGLAVLGGLSVSIVPFIIYFGHHNALSDFLYGVLIFNLNYANEWSSIKGQTDSVRLIIRNTVNMRFILYLILLIICLSIRRRKLSTWGLTIILGATITYLTFVKVITYPHYFAITLPLVFLLSCYLLSLKFTGIFILIAILLIPKGLINDTRSTLYNMQYGMKHSRYSNLCTVVDQLIDKNIPPDELSSVYMLEYIGYPTTMWRRHVLSDQKYIWLQQEYSLVDEKSSSDVSDDIFGEKHKWIIINKKHTSPLMYERINRQYVVVDSIDTNILYKNPKF